MTGQWPEVIPNYVPMPRTIWQLLTEVHAFYIRNWNAGSCFQKMNKENWRKWISGEFFIWSAEPRTNNSTRIKTEASRHRRWNPDDFSNESSIRTTKASLIRYFILQFYLWGRGFSNFHSNELWAMVATNAVTHLEKIPVIRFLFIVAVWRYWKW